MKKILLLIIPAIGFYSCNKEISQTIESTQVDVYVAGFISDGANYPQYNPIYDEQPTYWKNGSPMQLNFDDSWASNRESARALSIAVSGNNVYVVGYQLGLSLNRGYLPMGLFWKNGLSADRDSMNINDTYELTSLGVSNNDVYMAGWGPGNSATYWKNESMIELSGSSSSTSIAVSGNDVYVAGASSVNGSVIAEYWKNGNLVKLTDGSKDAFTSSIAVSGTDVYVAGNDRDSVAKYWKNGTLVNLTDGLTGAVANSIAVSGTDVYVAGSQWDGNLIQNSNGITYRNPIAKFWKNSNPVKLTDGSTWAEAKSIALSGSDVYVAGFEDGVAKYWKNGSPVILGDVSKYSEAYSIFLVKH